MLPSFFYPFHLCTLKWNLKRHKVVLEKQKVDEFKISVAHGGKKVSISVCLFVHAHNCAVSIGGSQLTFSKTCK